MAFAPNDRDFIGRQALESVDSKLDRELVGLVFSGGMVLHRHQKVVLQGSGVGISGADELIFGGIASDAFSPTLRCCIALAPVQKTKRTNVQVAVRGKLHHARIVKRPFVRV